MTGARTNVRTDDEANKFTDDSEGNVAVNTITELKNFGKQLPAGTTLAFRKDTSVSGRTIYGYAAVDSTTDEAVWLIYAEDVQGSDTIRVFAEVGGDQVADFVHIWDDRLTIMPDPPLSSSTYSTSFNGVDEYCNGGDIHQFDIANAYTVSMLVKPNNLAATRILFSKAGPAPTVQGVMVRHNATTGNIRIQLRTGATNRAYDYTSSLVAGVWQRLTFTYDGSANINGVRIYIEDTVGPIAGNGNLTGSLLAGQDWLLGQRTSGFHYSGLMDEVTVWNKALNQTEVTEIYNNGVIASPLTHSANSNLTSWYRMGDGDTSPTISDNKGSDDLTMVNMDISNFSTDVLI